MSADGGPVGKTPFCPFHITTIFDTDVRVYSHRHCNRCVPMDSPCECEHNNADSLDARLFFTVVLAVAPAVTIDEASSLSVQRRRKQRRAQTTPRLTD